jgi:hypothetical protein
VVRAAGSISLGLSAFLVYTTWAASQSTNYCFGGLSVSYDRLSPMMVCLLLSIPWNYSAGVLLLPGLKKRVVDEYDDRLRKLVMKIVGS